MTTKASKITFTAAIAAVYTVLGYISGLLGLGFGPVQLRISEAMCLLPFLFPQAGMGLFIGCLLTNLMSAYGPVDIIFGSLATLAAAALTARAKNKYLAALPPVIINGVVVGAVASYAETGFTAAFLPLWAYNGLSIALGEAAVCFILGTLLLKWLGDLSYFKKLADPERLNRI